MLNRVDEEESLTCSSSSMLSSNEVFHSRCLLLLAHVSNQVRREVYDIGLRGLEEWLGSWIGGVAGVAGIPDWKSGWDPRLEEWLGSRIGRVAGIPDWRSGWDPRLGEWLGSHLLKSCIIIWTGNSSYPFLIPISVLIPVLLVCIHVPIFISVLIPIPVILIPIPIPILVPVLC